MALSETDLRSRCDLLRSLQRPGDPLLLPNAWDVATARAVVAAGFPVVATTSGGVAATLGFEDHEGAPAEEMLAAAARIVRGVDVPVSVEMRADREGETWTRNFGGRTFRSRLAPGRRPGRVTVRFGLLTFDLDLAAGPAGLDLTIVGGRLGPLRLPRILLPASAARERVDGEGRFCFEVLIGLPGVGEVTIEVIGKADLYRPKHGDWGAF